MFLVSKALTFYNPEKKGILVVVASCVDLDSFLYVSSCTTHISGHFFLAIHSFQLQLYF
jgi:hypothetical protein